MAPEQLSGQPNKFVLETGTANGIYTNGHSLRLSEPFLAQMQGLVGKSVELKYSFNEWVGIPFEEPSGFTQGATLDGTLVDINDTHAAIVIHAVEDSSRHRKIQFTPGRQYSLPFYHAQGTEGASRTENISTFGVDGQQVFDTVDEYRRLASHLGPLYSYYELLSYRIF